MKAKNRKKLIISLIQDDLIHAKLIEGLEELGLSCENYMLNLSDTIIELMDFKQAQNEFIFEHYLDQLKRTRFIDNKKNNAAFKKLANEIYNNLQAVSHRGQ